MNGKTPGAKYEYSPMTSSGLQKQHEHPCQRHGPAALAEGQRPLLRQWRAARYGHDGPQEIHTTFPPRS
eukprot:9467660-Pyramimonas_sp.AAC.1